MTKPEPKLWLDGNRGVYLPQAFAESFPDRQGLYGVSEDDWKTLSAGPDEANYWEVWADVIDHATVALEGRQWTLHHDMDLWLVPNGMVWDDEADWFVWPDAQPHTK